MQNYNVTPVSQRKKDKKFLSYVQENMVCTHACIYLRFKVLELANYDHSQGLKGTSCLPLLWTTSQKTIILNNLHTKVCASESRDHKQCCDIMSCSLTEEYKHFGRACCLNLQGLYWRWTMPLNAGTILTDCMKLRPKTQQSSTARYLQK
jgi:hypothetical protein